LIIAVYLTFIHDQMEFLPLLAWQKTVLGAILTTVVWIIATYFTPKTDAKTLINFYRLIKPGGPGWKQVVDQIDSSVSGTEEYPSAWKVPLELLATVLGCFTVFGTLFATGYWIYGKYLWAGVLTLVATIGVFLLFRIWRTLRTDMLDESK